MGKDEADFFRAKLLPIIRDAANDHGGNPMDRNPLRSLLRQLIEYVEYLEAENKRLQTDKERLDWLASEVNGWAKAYRRWTGEPPFPETLRAAIDAARKGQG